MLGSSGERAGGGPGGCAARTLPSEDARVVVALRPALSSFCEQMLLGRWRRGLP